VPLELFDQNRGAFCSPVLVTDGIFDLDFIENGAVIEGELNGIAN